MNNNINSNCNFGAATHVYFFTSDGKRIVSDQNIKKCERYLVRQLNDAKNLKSKNQELVDTFIYDKKANVGDKDFWNMRKVRSVYEYAKDRAKGFVNIITGNDTKEVDKLGKEIGKAKHIAKERTGSTSSFETTYAVDRYNKKAPEFADTKGIYKDGKRQAFGVIFEPQYKKNGELKGFEYKRCGYFDEERLAK